MSGEYKSKAKNNNKKKNTVFFLQKLKCKSYKPIVNINSTHTENYNKNYIFVEKNICRNTNGYFILL